MTTDIRLKLEFLCGKQIAELNQSYFLGKEATSQTDTINASFILGSILSYSTFDSKWLPASFAGTPSVDQVYMRAPKNKVWYTPISFAGSDTEALTGLTTNNRNLAGLTKDVFLNFTNLLKEGGILAGTRTINTYTTSRSEVSVFANLLDLLNTMRVTYNVLGEKSFAMFRNALQKGERQIKAPVPTYELEKDGNGKVHYKTESSMTVIKSYVEKIIPNIGNLDASTTNLDAIRRILFGYELMIHVYIAAKLVNALSYDSINNTVTGPSSTNILNLLNSTIKQIRDYNDAVYKKSGVGSVGQLNDLLEERIQQYNRSKASIEEINKELDDLKLGVTLEGNNVESNKSFFKRSNVIFVTFATVCIVCAIMLLAAQQGLLSQNVATNKIIALSVMGIAVVSLVVIYILNNNYVYEPFVDPTANTLNNFIMVYTNQALDAFTEYVSNSLYLAMVINTYKRYGDISHSISKEQNYYSNTSMFLKQNQDTLQSMQVDSYRKGKVLQYRVYLLLQVLITLSLASVITLYSSNPNMKAIVGVTAILVLIWVYFYILNTQRLVHTDATKIYWGQPLITEDM